ncbi:SusC/RagA family TonB-linked outer membrane protein [Polaribacter reichenbachii]|nr:TonB-dependent receptor [Polaribacter reichenbachii]
MKCFSGFKKEKMFFLIFFSLGIFTVFGQSVTITGKVTDDTNEPIPGVNVLIKGTQSGTITDFDGLYKLKVAKSDILVFSYIGYATKEVAVSDQTTINVKLESDATSLDEIVVVGYGTQKKIDVTGAVTRANIEDFRDAPNANIGQSLQGTVPGLNIGQVTSAGSTPSIQIRGASTLNGNQSVLIILDGIQYTNSLSSLNPDDIESIDVLKDASSTAVYGAQAANGVILITTKKGRKNRNPVISFSSKFSTQAPSVGLRPMGREGYLEHIKMLNYRDAYIAPEYTVPNPDYDVLEYVDSSVLDPITGELLPNDFDWWDQATQRGYIQETLFNVSGGSEKTTYLISLGLTEQNGYIINDNFERKSIRVNLETEAADWWTVGTQVFGSFTNKDGAEPSLSSIVRSSPLHTPYLENGDLNPSPFNTLDRNPFLTYDVLNEERDNYISANLYSQIDVPFIPGLSYRINFGNNYKTELRYGASEYEASENGAAYKNTRFKLDFTLDNIITYKKKFGKHDISATYLYGVREKKEEGTNASATVFSRLKLGYDRIQLGENQFVSSYAFTEKFNYQMFRLNYKFNDKYLLTGTIREDGFSGFAENEKYGYFPSGAFGWIISNESFMENTDWINNLKLRGGYGVSGNLTGRYSSLARLSTGAAYVFGDGGATVFGQQLSSLANPNLRWERTAGMNLGLDFSLFNSRLTGSIDAYQNTTNDLLFSVALPQITGFSSIQTNIGKMQNKGLEISLTGDIIKKQDFSWGTTVNFSTNKNKILELTGEDVNQDGVEDDLIASNLFIGQGTARDVIYTYEQDGIYQIGDDIPAGFSPGQLRIVDQNDDGIINEDDRKIIGRRDPAYRISMLNTFKYKQFSFSFFLNSIQGGKDSYLSNTNVGISHSDNTIRFNYLEGINFWQPNNPTGDQPLTANGVSNPSVGAGIYQDRSFVRLQDVSLRYNFNQAVLDKLGMSSLSLFLSGKNLATWTDWKGWDPEIQDVDRGIYGSGLVAGGRPVMKGVSIGVNLSF